jgi:FkbM family methyltransferase
MPRIEEHMENNKLRTRVIEASKISEGSRWSRLLKSPVNVLTPYLMRKAGLRRDITVDTAWGGKFSGILPEAVSSEIWRSGTFELPVSLSLFHFLKQESSYLDIGAHFGYFSLLASKLVGQTGRVLSIEAMPSTFEYLKRNIERNAAHDNVTLFQGAAFSERTELEFRDFGVVASSLNSAFAARDTGNIIENQGKSVVVQAHRVDDIIHDNKFARIDLVKIDAESSEKFVLMGISKALRKFKPAIVMEVGDADPTKNTVRELITLLAESDYRPFYWNDEQLLKPYTNPGFVPYANLVFCHNDHTP